MHIAILRTTFISLISIVFLACTTKDQSKSENPESIQEQELENIVSYLSSDELQGRKTGSSGIEKAAQFIEKEFANYGITPYFDSYRDEFDIDGKPAFNLVGMIPGQDKNLKHEIVMVSAHYDHIGRDEDNTEDKIANGANDNASGTASVLALARHFSKIPDPKRSIVFTLFSAEEIGKRGSQHLAAKLKQENVDLYTVINFEMIGVPLEDNAHTAYITGYDRSNMAAKLNQYTQKNTIGFSPQAEEYSLFERSDNYPFYKTFNIPAHTITSFEFSNYPHYHKTSDEARLLDYQHMEKLLNELIPAVSSVVNSSSKEIRLAP